ncbi:hypothetical protein [uncultured Zoogloea sp.]|uniref:hypothetical protein n=1 Tax=uncultured Zoogloea sp. TaxID=160237 RepID=UPI001A4C28D0|nr:hypothetical protein [uncultured Zoogloea sp.]MBL8434665.1 hypothetical protein [Zoogloea sp.]
MRADVPTADRHVLQLAEQGIEFGRHAGAHPGHHRHDPWQGQMAIAGKSARAPAHLVDQGGVEEELGKLVQQRLRIEFFEFLMYIYQRLIDIFFTGSARVLKEFRVRLIALLAACQSEISPRSSGRTTTSILSVLL